MEDTDTYTDVWGISLDTIRYYELEKEVQNTSNVLATDIWTTSNLLANQIIATSNVLATEIKTTSNVLANQIIITSNVLANQIGSIQQNYFNVGNVINNNVGTFSNVGIVYNEYPYNTLINNACNIINSSYNTFIGNTSNFIYGGCNTFKEYYTYNIDTVTNLTADGSINTIGYASNVVTQGNSSNFILGGTISLNISGDLTISGGSPQFYNASNIQIGNNSINTFYDTADLTIQGGSNYFTYNITSNLDFYNSTIDTVLSPGTFYNTCNVQLASNCSFYNTEQMTVNGNVTNIETRFLPRVDLTITLGGVSNCSFFFDQLSEEYLSSSNQATSLIMDSMANIIFTFSNIYDGMVETNKIRMSPL